MPMRSITAAVAASLACVVLSSCGGSHEDAGAKPRALVERFARGMASRDYTAACRTLTYDFVWGSASPDTTPPAEPGTTCEEILDLVRQMRAPDPTAPRVQGPVRVRGTSASVGTSAGTIEVGRRPNGPWRITDISALTP